MRPGIRSLQRQPMVLLRPGTGLERVVTRIGTVEILQNVSVSGIGPHLVDVRRLIQYLRRAGRKRLVDIDVIRKVSAFGSHVSYACNHAGRQLALYPEVILMNLRDRIMRVIDL